jgi:hypothetical protein
MTRLSKETLLAAAESLSLQAAQHKSRARTSPADSAEWYATSVEANSRAKIIRDFVAAMPSVPPPGSPSEAGRGVPVSHLFPSPDPSRDPALRPSSTTSGRLTQLNALGSADIDATLVEEPPTP